MTDDAEHGDRARETERVSKADARRTGIGEAPDGVELPAADPETDSGAGFLGVGELADSNNRPDERSNQTA